MPSLHAAMPVAHQTSSGYANYYDRNDSTPYTLGDHFDENDCAGLELLKNQNFQGSVSDARALYAVTSGYLSYQLDDSDSPRLVLRLPRSLRSLPEHNSGRRFYNVWPGGPNLRHVVYELTPAAESDVRSAIGTLLNDANHPMRMATAVTQPVAGEDATRAASLGSYLSSNGNPTEVLDAFMQTGENVSSLELLVTAGDAIGAFVGNVTVSFYDSCGNRNPDAGGVQPFTPKGRPLNPAYFLYVLTTPENTTGGDPAVTMETSVSTVSGGATSDRHPIQTLLETIADGDYEFMTLDIGADHPPPPRHVTVDQNGETGIRIGSLAEFHQSRNGTNPYHPGTPYACAEWRLQPPQSGSSTNVGELVAQGIDSPELNQSSMTDDLVDHAGDSIDFTTEISDIPNVNNLSTITNQVTGYWDDYGALFNAVAEGMQVPCELLVALAAKETGSTSNETRATRLEQLEGRPPSPSATLTDRLNKYEAIDEDSYTFPIPWNGSEQISTTNDLTWGELASLTANHPSHVEVSPGIMQTLVDTADSRVDFARTLYGSTHLTDIQASVSTPGGSVTLSVDDPPSGPESLFTDWLAVAKDASGNAPSGGSADNEVSELQQAFHQITVGAAHVKYMYNHSNGANILTDYDPPTVASGYNDGAEAYSTDPINADWVNTDWVKYHRRYGLKLYGSYPGMFPLYYNEAVSYFNGSPSPTPSVRLWGQS